MEYKALANNIKNLAPNGVTLNIEEKMQVRLALAQLQGEMNFEELYFWGKVEGKYCPQLMPTEFTWKSPHQHLLPTIAL